MIVDFNKLNKAHIPSLILCNADGSKLFSMAMAKNRNISINMSAISELTFEVAKYNDDSIIPYYDYLIGRRYVEIENIGRFIITNVDVESNGLNEYKSVRCMSLEYELASKNISLLEGTHKLYDPTSSDTILGMVLSYLPNWSIGVVEDDLWNIYRTFDVKDNNIYNFLMSEVQEAFQCVFIFDTFRRTISAKTLKTLVNKTDIFISDRNIMKFLAIHESVENVITALSIYGDGDLSIHSVNPLGTSTLYDFSYYKNVPDMMSQELISAIDKWEQKVESVSGTYTKTLKIIKDNNAMLVELNAQLTDLDSQLKALEDEQAIIVAGDGEEGLEDVNGRIEGKKNEIKFKKSEIDSKKGLIDSKRSELSELSKSLKFESNFTETQINELSLFIVQATHQCTNFSVTDLTTDNERLQIVEDLMKYGEEQLKRLSQPEYTFDISVVNFTRLIEYKDILDQFELGCEITICVDRKKDRYAKVMLLGYSMNLDNPEDLELHFSSTLKFGNQNYTFEEIINQANSVGTTVDFESPKWDVGQQANNKIDDYINNALDLTLQEIVSSDNQEFTLTRQGLRGKKWLPELERYSPEEIWMTQNVLAFSDDGFQTRPKTAIGKILLPDGTKGYGLAAQALVGNITLTKQLIVENMNSTFRVDGDSVFIKNANIIMTNDEGRDVTLEDILEQNKQGVTVDGSSGILGDILAGKNNIICANSATGRVLALNENGIIVGSVGAGGVISEEGTFINKDGINASMINTGTLSALNINGCNIEASNGKAKILINPNVGIKIQKSNLSNWDDTLFIDANGDAIFKGKLEGNSLNINDKFTVDRNGNCVAKSIKISGSDSVLDARDMTVKNLVVGENVLMGDNVVIRWGNLPEDVADMSSVPSDKKIRDLAIDQVGAALGITSTTIGRSFIESPSIRGGRIEGAEITQESAGSNNWGNCQLIGGRLQLLDKSNRYLGAVMGDNSDKKLWIEGMNALKLQSYDGDISINPLSKNGQTSDGKIYMYGHVVVVGGKITDEKGNPLGGGSAVFG